MAGSPIRSWYSGFRVEKFTSGREPLFFFMARTAETNPDVAAFASIALSSPQLEADLRERIRKHAAGIINGLIQKAEEGGAVQAKFLFDFAGLSASPPPEKKGESLLELMRRELELEEPPEGTVE
jgi:hypothetical protein